jgi:predicted nucleic acid-binding protein
MTTVVDASVVVDWIAPDVGAAAPAGALLDRLAQREEQLAAPHLLLHEVANALLTGIRRGRWSGAQADAAHRHLQRLPIRLADQPADASRAFELARRYDEHPVYDMVYLAMAERLSSTLVTADHRLLARVSHLSYVVDVDGAGRS